MTMLVHTARVEARAISCEPRAVVQNGVNSDAILLDLDREWESFDRISLVVSKDGASTAIPYLGEPVPVPYEAMRDEGEIFLSVIGRKGNDVRVVTRRMSAPLQVVPSGDVDGTYEPGDPALDEVQQAIKDAEDAADAANAAAERAGTLPTIACGSGAPTLGRNRGDLYIDYGDGTLYEYQDAEGE